MNVASEDIAAEHEDHSLIFDVADVVLCDIYSPVDDLRQTTCSDLTVVFVESFHDIKIHDFIEVQIGEHQRGLPYMMLACLLW